MDFSNPQRTVQRLIARAGQEVCWKRGEKLLCSRAVVLPLRSQNRRYWEKDCVPEGRLESGYFQYIGSAEGAGPLLCARDLVQWNGEHFLVKSCEKMMWKGIPAYIWGILQRYSGEEEKEEKFWEN